MLIRLTKACRWRAAAVVAVLYAVCVLAPTTVMAFGDSARAAHCLTENHHAIGNQSHHLIGKTAAVDAARGHGNGVAHKHSNPDKTSPNGNNGDCCGLMCLFAMSGTVAVDTDFVRPLAPLAAVKPSLGGVDPGLLFKPPKS